MSTQAIRHKLYDYIRIADDKKVHSIYNLLEGEIEKEIEWWKNAQFISELDDRHKAIESGVDKGVTIEKLNTTIDKLRKKMYGSKR